MRKVFDWEVLEYLQGEVKVEAERKDARVQGEWTNLIFTVFNRVRTEFKGFRPKPRWAFMRRRRL